MNIIIDKENEGKTVKEYLFSVMKLSRAMVSRLKQMNDGIVLNGNRVTVRAILSDGDDLAIALDDRPDEVNHNIEPVGLPLNIVYEDEYIIIVNKEGGVPVHPSHDHHGDSLANAVAAYYLKQGIVSNFRAVNRLDKDTSGLVIIAKGKMSANSFSKLISSGGVRKSYYALLTGRVDTASGRIETYIKRERESIITRCNCGKDEGGAFAVTEFETVCSSDDLSLIVAHPITGRTHQLRVHFAGIGHPIIGDSLYGKASERISRQALHAFRLEFVHPLTHKEMTVSAQIPDDMKKLMLQEDFEINDQGKKQG